MRTEPQPQVATTADRLRDEFLVTLRELDRRRHRAMDIRGLVREHRRVLVAAGAGLAALVVVIAGTTSLALSRSRRARLPGRLQTGLRRFDGVPVALGLLLALIHVAAEASGAQRALPAGN